MLDKSDRKLLMLAATAVGYLVRADLTYEDGIVIDDGVVWNPLTDDGDALRLAVKLGIRVTPYPIHTFPKHSVIASQRQVAPADDEDNTWVGPEVIELYGSDPLAATRRAIVKVAAEIGKSLTKE